MPTTETQTRAARGAFSLESLSQMCTLASLTAAFAIRVSVIVSHLLPFIVIVNLTGRSVTRKI